MSSDAKENLSDGQTQKRGLEPDEGDRLRVTLAVQQDSHGWFGESPTLRRGRPLSILVGGRARSSNTSDGGRIAADEQFEYLGVQRVREAGSHARGLLSSWVKLRQTSDEIRDMLDYAEFTQQPAGFQGSILAK